MGPIAAGVEAARQAGAPAVEAHPLDAELTPSSSHTGYASTFARAGFEIVTRHVPPRLIMRYELRAAPNRPGIPPAGGAVTEVS